MGMVFELGKRVLYNFGTVGGSSDGSGPQGMVQATDGILYGQTVYGGKYSVGTFFKLTTSGEYTHLYDLNASNGSIWSMLGMVQHTDGKLYGVTGWGGTQQEGTFFRLDIGQGPFIALVRYSGGVGDTVQILGQDLTGSTAVTFNGVPTTGYSVLSDKYMTAVVPSGATTGPVVVTTPTRTLTSNKNLQVSP
jgi:hypothetical protein